MTKEIKAFNARFLYAVDQSDKVYVFDTIEARELLDEFVPAGIKLTPVPVSDRRVKAFLNGDGE